MPKSPAPSILNTLSDPRVFELLMAGKVGVLPTDTLYGLVCRAADQAAVQHLYAIKQRHHKPGTLIAASIQQFIDLGIKARYLKAVEQFWPNAISIIIPHELDYLDQQIDAQPVRVVKEPQVLIDLLQRTGPLLTSSANQPGQPPANTIEAAQAAFGETVDFYVDGGDLSHRQPSTIVRIIDDAIEMIRPGAVQLDAAGRIQDTDK